jgi:hypothetical protein
LIFRAAVLSLDANDVSYEITANIGYSDGSQNTWVDKTLAAHRVNPDIDFTVCFFHHCAYSTTEAHASDGGVRAAGVPLFDRYQVDLVLQGHNHSFERSDPIGGGAPIRVAEDDAIVYPETDGTVYYTVGSAGRRATPSSLGSRRATADTSRPTPSWETAMSGPPTPTSRPKRSVGHGCGSATTRSS